MSSLPFLQLEVGLMQVYYVRHLKYVINQVSQFNNCFDKHHWETAKRMLRYPKGTKDQNFPQKSSPIFHADANWGNNIVSVVFKSYSGYAFVLSRTAVTWCSRKQKTIASSSIEAEYMCITAAKEAIFLSNYLNGSI